MIVVVVSFRVLPYSLPRHTSFLAIKKIGKVMVKVDSCEHILLRGAADCLTMIDRIDFGTGLSDSWTKFLDSLSKVKKSSFSLGHRNQFRSKFLEGVSLTHHCFLGVLRRRMRLTVFAAY